MVCLGCHQLDFSQIGVFNFSLLVFRRDARFPIYSLLRNLLNIVILHILEQKDQSEQHFGAQRLSSIQFFALGKINYFYEITSVFIGNSIQKLQLSLPYLFEFQLLIGQQILIQILKIEHLILFHELGTTYFALFPHYRVQLEHLLNLVIVFVFNNLTQF